MSYHDEAGGDGVAAAMTQIPKLGPVVLLAEEPALLLIVPVGQGGTALTASETHCVPISAEGLEVLLIIDPLSASRTHGQTSTSFLLSHTFVLPGTTK